MSGRRELAFARLPYIAVYRVVGDSVEISRIYHGARIGLSLERAFRITPFAGR